MTVRVSDMKNQRWEILVLLLPILIGLIIVLLLPVVQWLAKLLGAR